MEYEGRITFCPKPLLPPCTCVAVKAGFNWRFWQQAASCEWPMDPSLSVVGWMGIHPTSVPERVGSWLPWVKKGTLLQCWKCWNAGNSLGMLGMLVVLVMLNMLDSADVGDAGDVNNVACHDKYVQS